MYFNMHSKQLLFSKALPTDVALVGADVQMLLVYVISQLPHHRETSVTALEGARKFLFSVNILFVVVQCALKLESTTTNVTDVSFCLVCRCVHVLNMILQRVFRLQFLAADLTRILLLHISLVPVGLLMFSKLMCGGKLSGTILASLDSIVIEDSVSLHR